MTWAHVHLAINHLPVILVPVAAAMLVTAWMRKSTDLTKAGLVILIVAAVSAGGAYLTGEPAESVVEDLPSVSDSAIEAHEEAALQAAVVTALAGLLAVGALATGHRPSGAPAWIAPATLVVAFVAAALLARTANLGGLISHPEIRGPVPIALRPTM